MSGSASEQLGWGAIVGDEIWNQQSGVRIKMGPLSLTEYLDFLPSGTAHEPLKSLAKFISRGEIDFEVQLILKKDEVPACELGSGRSCRAETGLDFLGEDRAEARGPGGCDFFNLEAAGGRYRGENHECEPEGSDRQAE